MTEVWQNGDAVTPRALGASLRVPMSLPLCRTYLTANRPHGQWCVREGAVVPNGRLSEQMWLR